MTASFATIPWFQSLPARAADVLLEAVVPVQLGNAALQGTRQRVARSIALLAHSDVSQSAEGRANISTSREALAMMLGISRPTLSKELQALVNLGAIRLRSGHIEIQDMSPLLSVS